MTDKVTLTPIGTFVNDSTAVSNYNNNLTTITSGFDQCLFLNGTAPNQMQSSLDMNSNHIINLPAPGSNFEPVRLIDVTSNNIPISYPVADLTGTGTGVITALENNVNAANGIVTYSGALGTPTSGVGTNLTALNASNITSGTLSASYGGSRMVLINTLNPSNVATIGDTTSLTSTYSYYEIQFFNVIPATTNSNLELQVYTGSYQATSYVGSLTYSGNAVVANESASTCILLTGGVSSTTAYGGATGWIRVPVPSNTAYYKIWNGQSGCYSGSYLFTNSFSGMWNSATTAVSGFQLLFSSGNITSGTIKVYGIL